jgi:ABC-type antimicrobial peptide transport system permease subunit
MAIAGLGTTVCRHGFVVGLVNVFHGERHAYATWAVKRFCEMGFSIAVFWYDIACRWMSSLEAWRDGLSVDGDLRKRVEVLQSVVPPMHVHAHK